MPHFLIWPLMWTPLSPPRPDCVLVFLDSVCSLSSFSVALSLWPRLPEATGSVPIQTSPNCPFPRRLMSCSDSRGISHTSFVLTDRSARRGIPLWQGTTKRQQSPAARSARATQHCTNKTEKAQRDMCRVSAASCRSEERFKATRLQTRLPTIKPLTWQLNCREQQILTTKDVLHYFFNGNVVQKSLLKRKF